jgi:hypothetical protein
MTEALLEKSFVLERLAHPDVKPNRARTAVDNFSDCAYNLAVTGSLAAPAFFSRTLHFLR